MQALARHLRNHQTHAELRLWHRLRRKQIHGVQAYRQRPVAGYIVDFYIPAAKLVIEVDGSQHHTLDGFEADRRRDAALGKFGFTVLRFDNRQVLLETDAVVEEIARQVARRLHLGE